MNIIIFTHSSTSTEARTIAHLIYGSIVDTADAMCRPTSLRSSGFAIVDLSVWTTHTPTEGRIHTHKHTHFLVSAGGRLNVPISHHLTDIPLRPEDDLMSEDRLHPRCERSDWPVDYHGSACLQEA